jgi:hypothetical protein
VLIEGKIYDLPDCKICDDTGNMVFLFPVCRFGPENIYLAVAGVCNLWIFDYTNPEIFRE